MTREEMERVALQSTKRTERDKLINKGVEVIFGNDVVCVKALKWKESNRFEDAVVQLVKKFRMEDLKSVKISEFVESLREISGQDLLNLASIALGFEVTEEMIEEKEVYKSDIVEVVIAAFKVNYGFLKNLLALLPSK